MTGNQVTTLYIDIQGRWTFARRYLIAIELVVLLKLKEDEILIDNIK